MIKKYSKNLVPWILVILWMFVIFFLSAQSSSESNSLSTGLTQKIEVVIERIINIQLNTADFNHIIRKSAHFTAYLILGVLISAAFSVSTKYNGNIWIKAWIICVLYAASDEFHQLFVLGRGSQVTDVMIDSLGALIGILLYMMIREVIKKKLIK